MLLSKICQIWARLGVTVMLAESNPCNPAHVHKAPPSEPTVAPLELELALASSDDCPDIAFKCIQTFNCPVFFEKRRNKQVIHTL